MVKTKTINKLLSLIYYLFSRGQHVEKTAPYLANIVKYLNNNLGISFQELIGDFIKDESGTWWLINIKGFILADGKNVTNFRPITHYGDEDYVMA